MSPVCAQMVRGSPDSLSAIDGWKSNFNRSGEINDGPRNHFTERSRAMILIPDWDLKFWNLKIFYIKWVLSSVWRRINWLYLTFYPRKISFPIGWILEIGTINWMRTFGTFDRNRNIHLTINEHLTRVLYVLLQDCGVIPLWKHHNWHIARGDAELSCDWSV